jgi:predicted MFS family arabinose efflux permease
MLSHAASQAGGFGWAFGLHEALDQFGALFGPLAVAGVLVLRGDYHVAFAALVLPAVINLGFVVAARLLYPAPEKMESPHATESSTRLPPIFWIYLGGAVLVAAGFADFPLISYHFAKSSSVSTRFIPVFYAVAMGLSGTGSLVFGRLFDRFGFGVLIVLTICTTLFAPLAFLGGFWGAFAGMALWGIGMGVHESIIPAAVAPMVASDRRASAYGLFTAGYGIFWFFGSAALGLLYGVSITSLVLTSMILQLSALPFFLVVARRQLPLRRGGEKG